MRQFIIFGFALIIFSGCAPKTYYWGSYEKDLYRYYKSSKTPEDHERYMARLFAIMERAEKSSKPVPPGIYAEYGYGLYEIGKHKEAIEYFEKEKSLWPEANLLMEHLISNVRSIMAEDEKASLTSN